jgi:radical SAM protein with 4Fe4S-binding SPASM domain
MRSKIFCIVQMVALKENRHEIPDVIRMWNREGIDEVRIKKDEVCNESCAVPGSMTDRQPLRHPCFQLWRGPMYIHYDGTVFPCCYTYPDEALGNIATTPLRELWNSDKMMRMREAHIRGEARNYKCCVNCHSARPRLPVALGSFLINTHTLRRVLPFFERMAHLRNVSVFETLK